MDSKGPVAAWLLYPWDLTGKYSEVGFFKSDWQNNILRTEKQFINTFHSLYMGEILVISNSKGLPEFGLRWHPIKAK